MCLQIYREKAIMKYIIITCYWPGMFSLKTGEDKKKKKILKGRKSTSVKVLKE